MISPRLAGLALALLATAALAALGTPDGVTANTGPVMTLPIIRSLQARTFALPPASDPFAAAPPVVSPPAAATGAVPPAPTIAVPLPWRVLGKQQNADARWTVFLAQGELTRVVQVGDTLDDAWRVVAIDPPQLVLQHLRQKTRRSLAIGEARE